ncbi:MAG: pyrrolo-quinoline quinone, partial [Acidobacteria bacterium]|nr:pyrrolo-quinoline quinone [Acidobacteriota bacterium]
MKTWQAAVVGGLTVLAGGVAEVRADDWPEFRGEGRLGEWRETGLIESFPAEGLKVRWRMPIKAGFAGPAV